jgi:diguanylate cyclase (GGDEF)-like protein
MMREVSRTALAATDLDELLRSIVQYVHEHFEVELVAIELNDVATSAQAGAGDANAAELRVPIRFRGRALGTFHIESCSDEVFTPESVMAFESLAALVAGAIRLHRLSTTDALTGAANRRQFDDAIDVEWRRAARTQAPLTLMMIDIDHFKAFNDAHGHQAGDDCLRRVCDALRQRLHRAGDLIARYGGEEFAVLVTNIGAQPAGELAESLRRAVEEIGMTTISIGLAQRVPTPQGEADELIRAADAALYAAKNAGRNRVVVG